MYRIEQGIIKSYDQDNPRVCNVLQIPDGYMMTQIRLPNTLSNQIKPKEGSLVLVVLPDSYKGFLLVHLRDPAEFLSNGEGTRGVSKEFDKDLTEGEVYFESAGDPNSPVSGTGASIHLANDGTATISSGKLTEFISVGGEFGDNDNEIIVNADNITIKSNKDIGDTVESTMKFRTSLVGLDSIQIGRYVKVFPEVPPLPIPIDDIPLGELRIDQVLLPIPGMEITLQNKTLAGTPLTSLVMNSIGELSTSSLLSTNIEATTSINLNATTSLSLNSVTTTSLNSILGMTLDGLTINLNNGTFGVARLNDIVTSDLTTDPTWWTFWSTLSGLIAALPTTPLDGGATLKAGLVGLFSTVPVTILSKITSASTTVKAGN